MIYTALLFFLLNRFFDGVDGALARLQEPSDLGGFYDIISDFIIYNINDTSICQNLTSAVIINFVC